MFGEHQFVRLKFKEQLVVFRVQCKHTNVPVPYMSAYKTTIGNVTFLGVKLFYFF